VPRGPKKLKEAAVVRETPSYTHPEAEVLLRPEVGTQAQFRKKKEPRQYRYDSSLAPQLSWDGKNWARETGEWLLRLIEEAAKLPAPHEFIEKQVLRRPDGAEIVVRGLADAVRELKALSRPFLDWAGKAERLSFQVPSLPLFVHERLSTRAILETLKGHRRSKENQHQIFELFANPKHSIADQVLKAYEHKDDWVNRLILGDSLVVMNSLLAYEGMAGQVQMIYMDPPYGVKFGSNFQPFVRKRDVKHNDDEDLTREPEMVKAYRDTWELGLHSYLTYMRDRLLLARELMSPSGSVFVQISDENLHHVRELMDATFGSENFVANIQFAKTSSSTGEHLPATNDYLLFYARDIERLKFRDVYLPKTLETEIGGPYGWVELDDGSRRRMTPEERLNPNALPKKARVYRLDNLQSQSMGREKGEGAASWFPVELDDREWRPSMRARWKTNEEGMTRLKDARRLQATETGLYYVRFIDDFAAQQVSSSWTDTVIAGFASDKLYVVQTSSKAVERCLHMTTDPGDLVLDPTCGSGTTAFVAEQWGRRWVTIDTSRVPLALARQRLLTATFSYYQLTDEKRGPAGGFVYERKQNKKGEEVGGIVPHVTLKSIANDEPADEEVLVDRPEVESKVTRVTGPFVVEATIPTPVDWEGDGIEDSGVDPRSYRSFVERMLEVLRRSPVLQVGGGKTVMLKGVRAPARTLSLSAEAFLAVTERPVAFVFGPENGAVSEKLVYEAAKEAAAKSYSHLYVIGFAIQPNARQLVDQSEAAMGVAATYVQATPDLLMGDLLKNMRSSQIFSVCGLPEVKLHRAAPKDGAARYQVELLGLDTFDPTTMEVDHRHGDDVPAWLLDTDYNGLCFHVCQAFFPRTAAWDDLKRALKGQYEDSVWDHLAGAKSAPFEAGEHGQVAVKVIDDRGNELLVVKKLEEAST